MKTIFLLMVVAFGFSACCGTKVKSPKNIDWPSIRSLTFDEAETMANNYKTSITTSRRLNIREINLSAIRLAEVLRGCTELRLIMGAEITGEVVIILERRDMTRKKSWYRLTELFKNTQAGSLSKDPFCKNDPVRCIPTFETETVRLGLTGARAAEMADLYFSQSNVDYDKMILQINLQPDAVLPLLVGKFNVKLIPAKANDREDSSTIVLKFTEAGTIGYMDLKSKVPQPVCPPPTPCTLSEF